MHLIVRPSSSCLLRAAQSASVAGRRFEPVSFAHTQTRSFFFKNWLLSVWNKVDEDRLKKIGPDRASAEWIIRNGGGIRWMNSDIVIANYDMLDQDYQSQPPSLEFITAKAASVYWTGFDHLAQCKHVKQIELIDCTNIDDVAVKKIADHLSGSLEQLRIDNCPVTDQCLPHIHKLSKLRRLDLLNCAKMSVKESTVVNDFIQSMKHCTVTVK